MTPLVSPSLVELLVRAARGVPGLELLLLYGSRARRDDHPGSDWDVAYLATEVTGN